MENEYTFPAHLPDNLRQAAVTAVECGQIDGDHHKMWVIDQMLRLILGPDDYQDFLDWYNSDDDYSDWDHGIAP